MGCCTDKERISFLVPKSQCFPQTHKAHPQEQMSRLCLCCQGNQSVLSSRIRKPGPGLSSAFCSLLNRARHLFPTGDTKDHVTKSLALASRAGAPSTAHTSLAHTNKSMAGVGGGWNEFIHTEKDRTIDKGQAIDPCYRKWHREGGLITQCHPALFPSKHPTPHFSKQESAHWDPPIVPTWFSTQGSE